MILGMTILSFPIATSDECHLQVFERDVLPAIIWDVFQGGECSFHIDRCNWLALKRDEFRETGRKITTFSDVAAEDACNFLTSWKPGLRDTIATHLSRILAPGSPGVLLKLSSALSKNAELSTKDLPFVLSFCMLTGRPLS